jgi:hypothetical protein
MHAGGIHMFFFCVRYCCAPQHQENAGVDLEKKSRGVDEAMKGEAGCGVAELPKVPGHATRSASRRFFSHRHFPGSGARCHRGATVGDSYFDVHSTTFPPKIYSTTTNFLHVSCRSKWTSKFDVTGRVAHDARCSKCRRAARRVSAAGT